jgi:putative hydrolase of HD superfamily
MTEEIHRRLLACLPPEVKLLLTLEQLKDEERNNPLACNTRKERVAEHSWFVALSIPLLAQYSPEPLDVPKATLLAIVHDLAEAFVGDSFAFGPDVAQQHSREHDAMNKVRASADSTAIQSLVDLWLEYEAQETAEARFVKGMDAFIPILLNFTNIKSSSWVEHGVNADQVRMRLAKIRDHIGALAGINDEMINQAQAEGYLL